MGNTRDAAGALTAQPTPTQTVADLQAGYDRTEEIGGLLKVTSAERALLTNAQTKIGWLVIETDTGNIYERVSSGLKPLIEDTGWVSVTPQGTGFTPFGEGIKFRRINRVVYFIAAASSGGWDAGNWAMSPIPAGMEPDATASFTSSYDDVAKEVQFRPAGNIVIAKAGSGGITVAGSYPAKA